MSVNTVGTGDVGDGPLTSSMRGLTGIPSQDEWGMAMTRKRLTRKNAKAATGDVSDSDISDSELQMADSQVQVKPKCIVMYYNIYYQKYTCVEFQSKNDAIKEIMMEEYWKYIYEPSEFGPEDETTLEATKCEEALCGEIGICIGSHRKTQTYIRVLECSGDKDDAFSFGASAMAKFATDCNEYKPSFIWIDCV